MKRSILLVLLICGLISTSFQPFEPRFKDHSLKTLVIDAGHGGKDPGAHGDDSWEKDIALDIALKLETKLKEEMPDLNVLLTRDDDTFVELHNRAKVAYANDADFFISIHCNANNSSKPYGSETYIMGLHVENANFNMIMRENSAILLEENHEEKYDGFDPQAPESYIMFQLLQNAYLKQSHSMAKKVQQQFESVGRYNRDVKQAGFLVLWKASKPAILIETGFITNPEEEKFLNSEEGREHLAGAIFNAVADYRKESN